MTRRDIYLMDKTIRAVPSDDGLIKATGRIWYITEKGESEIRV